jgi:hypothetical protein
MKLVVLSEHAETQEARDAARRLLDAGRYRPSTREEDARENHPLMLLKEVSSALPVGLELTFDGLDEVPPSLACDPRLMCEAPTTLSCKEVSQEAPAAPVPSAPVQGAEAPVVESLEDRTSLAYKFAHLPQRDERTEPQPRLVKAEPSKPSDERQYIDW